MGHLIRPTAQIDRDVIMYICAYYDMICECVAKVFGVVWTHLKCLDIGYGTDISLELRGISPLYLAVAIA